MRRRPWSGSSSGCGESAEKLRWLLGKAVAAFGERPVGELRSEEVAAWQIALSPGYRFDATQALRQVPRGRSSGE